MKEYDKFVSKYKMAEGAVFEMFVFVVSTLGVIIYNTIITK